MFISHSANDDDGASAVLDLIRTGLSDKNYEVVVDRDVLKAGQEWSAVLYRELGQCDAAIVLLTPKALNSSWVRREVNILLWRRALGAPLHIVAALMSGTTPEAVSEAGFTELEPLQAAKGSSASAIEIAEEVLSRFVDLPDAGADASPMCEWLKRIAAYLKQVREPEALGRAANALGVDEESIAEVYLPDGAVFLAHQFLSHDGLGDASRRDTARAIAAMVGRVDSSTLRELASDVIPTWVDGSAARNLLPAPKKRSTVMLLNSFSADTAEHYICRAICCARLGFRWKWSF